MRLYRECPDIETILHLAQFRWDFILPSPGFQPRARQDEPTTKLPLVSSKRIPSPGYASLTTRLSPCAKDERGDVFEESGGVEIGAGRVEGDGVFTGLDHHEADVGFVL